MTGLVESKMAFWSVKSTVRPPKEGEWAVSDSPLSLYLSLSL